MVKPAVRREAVRYAESQYGLSERRACRLMKCWRSTARYQSRPDRNEKLRRRMIELSQQWRRAGYRQLGRLLRREGWVVNDKRVYRLYREAGLGLKRRTHKRIRRPGRQSPAPTQAQHERWAMDFIHDSLIDGRAFRILGVLEIHTRECLSLEADFSLPSERVIRVLERLEAFDQLPGQITVDNGPEFVASSLNEWLASRSTDLDFIEPGKPTQNAFIESFNRTLREECLNENWFASLREVQRVLEVWRGTYNRARPHSSLGGSTPHEFAQKQKEEQSQLR